MAQTDSDKDMQAFFETWWANRARGVVSGFEAMQRAAELAPLDPLAAMTALTDAASTEAFRLWTDQIEAARLMAEGIGSPVAEHHATPV